MNDTPVSRILTLVFTDLADSMALKTKPGDQRVGGLITRHRALFGALATAAAGRIMDWVGDGCFVTFDTPSAAVTFALHLQEAHGEPKDLPGVRTWVQMGELGERTVIEGGMTHPQFEDLAVDLTARIR
jgi:class 3 adenylate cyclase